jgi:hypothetical protein
LNHTNVVTTIPDTTYPLLGELPNEPCNVCFLSRGTSTSDDRRELGGDFDEFVPERIETELQGSAMSTITGSVNEGGAYLQRFSIYY